MENASTTNNRIEKAYSPCTRYYYRVFSFSLYSTSFQGARRNRFRSGLFTIYPDQEFKNSRIIITENGITTASVWAHRASVYEERNYTVIEDSIAIDFFNKEGEKVSTLTALSGEVWGLYEQVDSLRAEGDVIIISDERKAKMETPFIRWIAKTHMVYADSTVRLSTEDAVQTEYGLWRPTI